MGTTGRDQLSEYAVTESDSSSVFTAFGWNRLGTSLTSGLQPTYLLKYKLVSVASDFISSR